MTRLAVVIGVSTNLPPTQSLAACRQDAEAISKVLQETKRFSEILTLVEPAQTESKSVKNTLSDLVQRHRGTEVDEVVFYFSGHGDYAGNEFYHILSDYDSSARNRTSLANTELDGMIRGLAPKLFVKIVDACHSGTSYIKSNDEINDLLKSTKSGFRDLYFLYSSQSDQVSWTSGGLSAFTKCILTEVARSASGAVRYRDLMNAASDYFENSGGQTPQFVTQADYTHVFCDASTAMQAALASYLPKPQVPAISPPPPILPSKKRASLKDRIEEAEKQLCTKEETFDALKFLQTELEGGKVGSDLADVYDLSVNTSSEKLEEYPVIGEWLSKNIDKQFFATPMSKQVTYKKRVPKNTWASFSRVLSGAILGNVLPALSEDDYTYVDAVRDDVYDFESTCTLPYETISLRLEPKYRVVLPVECFAIVIVSGTHVRLFWTFRQYRRTDWDTVVPKPVSVKWEQQEVSIKNHAALTSLANFLVGNLSALAGKLLQAQWPDAQG